MDRTRDLAEDAMTCAGKARSHPDCGTITRVVPVPLHMRGWFVAFAKIHRPWATSPAAGGRGRNLAVVLADIREHAPTVRSDIGRRTGLSRPTVTNSVAWLIDAELVREMPTSTATGTDRPFSPLMIDGRTRALLAVQIRVDDIVIDCVDLGERLLATERRPHSGPGVAPHLIASTIARLVDEHSRQLRSRAIRTVGIVLVVAAPLVNNPPQVSMSIDLGWDYKIDLIGMLRAHLRLDSMPLDLVNDADMAAAAEHRALQQALQITVPDMIYLKADTGVGGGVILAGRLLRSARGRGFEPAHIVVRTDGAPCGCGRRGCLVAEAGLESVLTKAGLADEIERSGAAKAGYLVAERAAAGDPAMLDALRHAGAALSTAILDLSALFGPRHVVLGGYWSEVFDALEISLAEAPRLSRELLDEISADRTGAGSFVLPGRLGRAAARQGAIRAAVDGLFADPLALTGGN